MRILTPTIVAAVAMPNKVTGSILRLLAANWSKPNFNFWTAYAYIRKGNSFYQMENIDKIYVLVHPVYEAQRFTRLQSHFQSIGLPNEKIVYGAATWGSELSSNLVFSVWDPFLRPGVPNLTWKSRFLSKGEISLVLNFFAAISDAVKQNYTNVLIFESDVYLRKDFVSRMSDLWKDLSGDWDFVSLGEGIGTRPQGVLASYWSPTHCYKPPHEFVFRCTDSMLFRVEFLRKVVQTLLPFRECLDWELNYQLAIHRGKALWADPPLAEQGSSRCREPSLLPA
jgi:hypothetical protein